MKHDDYEQVPDHWVLWFRRFMLGWHLWAAPRFYGKERLPDDQPLLFVGNHTLMAAYDTIFLVMVVWDRYGKMLRGLADPIHFQIPLWGPFMTRFGAVKATREECDRLMKRGDVILTFPGGGREVSKSRGERYQLHWDRRIGFARMAMQHGCTIIPFSMVGADDAWDVRVDGDQMVNSPVLGPLLARLGLRRDQLPPVMTGVGPTIVPRPDRLYFNIGEPIPTRHLQDRCEDMEAILDLKARVKSAVEDGIQFLLDERARDPGRTLLGRILTGEIFEPELLV